jgi:hypothetical protein
MAPLRWEEPMGPDSDTPPDQASRPAPQVMWLPTAEGGGVRRATVHSFTVARVDGKFQGGSRSSWTITVHTTARDEPVPLRPVFLDAEQLCAFVDAVFPGAAYALLPPAVVTDSPDWDAAALAQARALGPTATQAAAAIKMIIEGALGGDTYTPEWRNYGQGSGHMS